MMHLTDLQCSMLADGALSLAENTALQGHLNTCTSCQSRIDSLRMESEFIGGVLVQAEPVLIPVPAFKKAATLTGVVQGIVGTAALTWILLSLLQILWQSLSNDLFTEIFSWFGSFHLGEGFGLTVTTVLYFSQEGNTMIDTMLTYVILGLLFSGIVGFMLSRHEFRGAVSLCLAVVMFGGMISSPSANALEIRSGDTQTIEATEIINDTLVVTGDTSIINGTINGDLVAFGRRVIVNGTVTGNLIVFTESVTISGRVEGSVMGFANMLELANAGIGSNLWGFANNVSVNADSNIEGNATIFSNTTSMAGDVGRDLTGFGQSVEMSGRVEGDVETHSERISLIGDAYVGGDVRFSSSNEKALQQSPSAVIIGMVEHNFDTTRIDKNKYLSVGFYVWMILRLVMAFLAGILLLWLFPRLREIKLNGGGEDVKTAGLGLLGIIFIPVLMVIAAVTVVGLPFALIGAFVLLLGLLFAKIIVASIIGRMIVSAPEKQGNYMLTLFAGLMAVMVLTNLPFAGGILGFIITILGFGILLQQTLGYTGSLNTSKG